MTPASVCKRCKPSSRSGTLAGNDLDPLALVIAQLVAIRASADAALGILGVPGDEDPDTAAPCEHPEDQRRDAGTSGNLGAFVCDVCHELVETKKE